MATFNALVTVVFLFVSVVLFVKLEIGIEQGTWSRCNICDDYSNCPKFLEYINKFWLKIFRN